ncbi:MAG TPA: right-handed parallel beta-helix repeat-containing protein [Steroidobacter sp.]
MFVTDEVVHALSYGLVGDGQTDNTQVFRNLLAGGNKTIHVPPGDYVTDKLTFSPNTVLVLEPGVTLRDAGRLGKYDRLLNIRTENVHIVGYGARVVSKRADYQTDEWRHGIHIFGARRVLIEGLESSSHGGDGFYIGGPAGRPSTDVMLKGCAASNNRRQGLSITSGRRIRVVDCEFSATNGTAPEFGVDLEPNYAEDFINDVILLRVRTINNRGGGIMIQLDKLDATSRPADITIAEHLSAREAVVLRTMVPQTLTATIRYSHAN